MSQELKEFENPLRELRLKRPPFALVAIFLVAVVVSWLPLVVAARRRVQTSPDPRIQIMQDMGNQPRYKAQMTSPVFADGRADRPEIPGTVARGHLDNDDHYVHGFTLTQGAPGSPMKANFFSGYPKEVTVDDKLVARGQQRFAIYCAPCHGLDASGHGMVNERAAELQEPKWVPAANLHSDVVKGRPEGHLFNTITNGIRNMPGYGSQIPVPDRWAIVSYIRALQLSQDAPASAVPPEKLQTLK
jgi:mono/diheme cytochrome c family protein